MGLAFAGVEEVIKKEIYERFGDKVKVNKVKLFTPVEKFEKIELDMEYGKSRAIAYVYSKGERYYAVIDALWKVEVFIALKDIEKGSPIEPVFLKREERFMKSIPSDLRLSFEELNNYVASTRIPKGTILRRSLLRELPAVKSGDVVDAVYKSGNIEINFQAIALDGGTVVKLIRIKRVEIVP